MRFLQHPFDNLNICRNFKKGLFHRTYRKKFEPRAIDNPRQKVYEVQSKDLEPYESPAISPRDPHNMDSELRVTPYIQRKHNMPYEDDKEEKDHISDFINRRNQINEDMTPPEEISYGEQPLDTNMRVYKECQSDLHKSPYFENKGKLWIEDNYSDEFEENKEDSLSGEYKDRETDMNLSSSYDRLSLKKKVKRTS